MTPPPSGETASEWRTTRLLPEGGSLLRRWSVILLALVVPPRNHRTAPTGAGWMIIVLSIAIGGAAYNTASNILFLALAFLLSALLLSGILSVVNFRGLRWRLVHASRFEAGAEGEVAIEIENTKRIFPSVAVWFRMAVGDGEAKREILRGRLDARKTLRLERRITPRARGRMPIRLSGVESTFPFGFLRKRLGVQTEVEALVWPRRMTVERVSLPGPPRRTSGERVRVDGRGTDLRQIRGYRPGDPFQDIHWKASARTGRLMIRETQEEGVTGYSLVVDPSRTLWKRDEVFETFCSVVASVARRMQERGDLLGFHFPGESFVPVRTRADLHFLLDRLAVLEPSSAAPLREVSLPGLAVYFQRGGEHGVIPVVVSGDAVPV